MKAPNNRPHRKHSASRKRASSLLSFAPTAKTSNHKYYVKQLLKSTSHFNASDNNIALEGGYSTGKSSILRRLLSWRHPLWIITNRPKTISFFSFNYGLPKDKNKKNNLANNGCTVEAIRREIVKQLYYSEKANKLKGSGYKRIGKSYYLFSLIIAVFISCLTIAPIFNIQLSDILSTNLTNVLPNLFNSARGCPPILILTIVSFVITPLINSLIVAIANGAIKHIAIKDLSADLLDDKPDFEQLIDLLVFYFRKTKRRVIIFEDLDRLDNPVIFEELRQLNFLINNRSRFFNKIKFIYAIREDVFDSVNSDDTKPESVKAKVFDIIIPVIPFLSEINFGSTLFSAHPFFSDKPCLNGISNIMSRHTSDMRVVKTFINYMLSLDESQSPKDETELKNCAAIAMIRTFLPTEYTKLSSGDSILDSIQKKCSEAKNDELNMIENRYSVSYKIKNHESEIIKALKTVKGIASQNLLPNKLTVNGNTIDWNDGALQKIFNANADVQITWQGRLPQIYRAQEIQKIFLQYISLTDDEDSLRKKEKQAISKKDAFLFYVSAKKRGKIAEQEVYGIVEELIENGFLTEDYMRFISASSSIDKNKEAAMKYIHNYIRGPEESYYLSLNEEVAKYIFLNTDNTDLSSPGFYNFSLLDYVIYNCDEPPLFEKLETIIKNASADLATFMRFFEEYSIFYKNALNGLPPTGLDSEEIALLSKTTPPIFLTEILARKYPEETIRAIAYSKLGDTPAREVLFVATIVSLEKPEQLTLDEKERDLISYYSNSLCGSEIGRSHFMSICTNNSILIRNLSRVNLTDNELESNLLKLSIEINESNILYLNGKYLINYLASRTVNHHEVEQLLAYSNNDTKKYLVEHADSAIDEDEITKCAQALADYACSNNLKMSTTTIRKISKTIEENALIKLVVIANLQKDELVDILGNCGHKQLCKILERKKRIRLEKNNWNEELAKQLIAHKIARRLRSNSLLLEVL